MNVYIVTYFNGTKYITVKVDAATPMAAGSKIVEKLMVVGDAICSIILAHVSSDVVVVPRVDEFTLPIGAAKPGVFGK